MDWDTDIKEIKMFLAASDLELGLFHKDCMERFTKVVSDSYLLERAEYVRNIYANDLELQEVLARLSTICDDSKKQCYKCPVNKYCNSYIEDQRNNDVLFKWNMVDLFCGAGGLSLGFKQEGFKTVLANDIEQCCIDTYAHNHPETPRSRIILGDIKEVCEQLNNILGDTVVDIVVGGPPCQGFSMANRQRLIDDPRNKLYRYYVKVVSILRPKFFVMENVKGMLPVAEQVVDDFQKLGYKVNYKVLNAKDYGVPQNRERLIYIGNIVDQDNTIIFDRIIESSKNIPKTVLGDALFGLRALNASKIRNATEVDSLESGYKIEKNNNRISNQYLSLINEDIIYPFVLNHKARYNNDRDIEIFSRLQQGDRSDDPKIADIMPYARRNDIFKDKYYKLVSDKVCKTITAHMKFDCNMYIHPTQARGLTPREAARVQSFPDDYFFKGAYTKTYMQIGNSVPPLLGRAIANIIKDYL